MEIKRSTKDELTEADVHEWIEARLDALRQDVSEVTLPDTTQTAEAESGIEAVDGSKLSATSLSYKNKVSVGQRSMNRPTTRTLASTTHDGTATWRIVDALENAAQADTLFIDRSTLRPIERRVGGRATVELTFDSMSVSGTMSMRGQTRKVQQNFDQPVLASTSNMEVALAALPLEPGYSAQLPVYQLQQQSVGTTTIRVTLAACWPAAVQICRAKVATLVLPLVPVTAATNAGCRP